MRNRNDEKSTGVIAITGTSRGIGKVVALELAQRGYQVACLSRGGHRPESADLDEDTRARLVPYVCDVLDEANVRAVFAEIPQRQGPLSVLINNAGFHVAADSHTFPTAEWERVMATNVTAVFQVSREAYPHLVANGGGTIINMGSFFDKLGTPRNTVYCASKAAVGAITRCLAVEWAHQGIRVFNVAPGYVETDLNREFLNQPSVKKYLSQRIPTGRPGTPEEVARFIALLISEELPSLTGETLYIDGGQGMSH